MQKLFRTLSLVLLICLLFAGTASAKMFPITESPFMVTLRSVLRASRSFTEFTGAELPMGPLPRYDGTRLFQATVSLPGMRDCQVAIPDPQSGEAPYYSCAFDSMDGSSRCTSMNKEGKRLNEMIQSRLLASPETAPHGIIILSYELKTKRGECIGTLMLQ